MGLQAGGHYQLGAGTGTVGYEPKVSYFFGFPKAIEPGGVVFDIPLFNIAGVNDGDPVKAKQFVLQSGLLSSALEHAVPEQLFVNAQNPGEAISAVKALQKASAAGQRIYHLTPANQSTILGNIHHDSDTMTEIKNALNTGKEVITHTDAVNVPGWSGAGYIITDPDTGAGAYKIAGGGNGSFFLGLFIGVALVTALILETAVLGPGGVLVASFILSASLHAALISLLIIVDAGQIDPYCLASGLAWGLTAGGLFGSLRGILTSTLGDVMTKIGLVSSFSDLPSAKQCTGVGF